MLLTETDGDGYGDTATWVSSEFFDGESAVIDTGFDRPTKARILYHDDHRPYIDVLSDGPPSPSLAWMPLTILGDHVHPDVAVFGRRVTRWRQARYVAVFGVFADPALGAAAGGGDGDRWGYGDSGLVAPLRAAP